MEEKIIEPAKTVYKTLTDAGFEAYLVGGCVRDLLLGREIKDWDLTTNATPEEVQKLFSDSFYDNTFGTVGIPFEEEKDDGTQKKSYLEVTTYRHEKDYQDARHPGHVEWGNTLEADLERRDFTINAIAGQLIFENNKIKMKIVDPLNGREDLEKKAIRAVGNPDERFKEDALRTMRAIRFASQLGFTISPETLAAISRDAHLITKIAYERVRDELLKILASSYPYEGIKLLDNTGILKLIIPELDEGKGISMVRPGRHHTTDVFTHNLLSLKFCPSNDPIVKLAALLHDAGKPKVEAKDEDGLVIFYNHEVVGAKIAERIADRLRLSKKDRERVYTLIRWHMFPVNENLTDGALRRFIRRVGAENIADMIDLRIGDRLGSGTQTPESWRLQKFKERIEGLLNPAFSINDLAIDGNDIMTELHIEPGPQIGKILQTLFEEVEEDMSKNNREYLLKELKS